MSDLLKEEFERHARELERIVSTAAVTPSPYYTQADSPLGKRAHCAAVNSGKLKGWKQGKKLFARRDDVHAFIEANPVKPKKKEEPTGNTMAQVNTASKLSSAAGVESFLASRGI